MLEEKKKLCLITMGLCGAGLCVFFHFFAFSIVLCMLSCAAYISFFSFPKNDILKSPYRRSETRILSVLDQQDQGLTVSPVHEPVNVE